MIGCFVFIDKGGFEGLIEKGKVDLKVVKMFKCKIVVEGKFRYVNYICDLEFYIVDEFLGFLGDDMVLNFFEVFFVVFGFCIVVGLYVNVIYCGIMINFFEVEFEGDFNIMVVWGIGDVSEKLVGFIDVCLIVYMDFDVF